MRWILLFLVSFSLSATASAQAALGMRSFSAPGMPDTTFEGATINYLVTVENKGNAVFLDSFEVYICVYGGGTFILDTVMKAASNGNVQMFPGDTVNINITHDIDTAYFVQGNNTIVIWPYNGNVNTTDSIYRDIYVIYFESVDEETAMITTLFPNPVVDEVRIRSDSEVELVRIYDMEGKLVLEEKNKNIFHIKHLSAGTYIVEITDGKGRTAMTRIVKR
jgi:hypothetical protein